MTHVEVLKAMLARYAYDLSDKPCHDALTAAIAALDAVGKATKGRMYVSAPDDWVVTPDEDDEDYPYTNVLIIPADAVDAVGGG